MSKKEPIELKQDFAHLYNIYNHLTENKEQRYQVLRTGKLRPWLYSQYLLDSAAPPLAEAEKKKI
ncbi:hypothetical protein VAWG002_12670 [Aeromonas veronii]|nr:hypothetical protein VAWG002_12670 [Aeromonas veronii]